MKIRNLTKRNEKGYTFGVQFGPFVTWGWWFNRDARNVVPPYIVNGGKQYRVVRGQGIHFMRLRDLVEKMIAAGSTFYDSDDMLTPAQRAQAPVIEDESESEDNVSA